MYFHCGGRNVAAKSVSEDRNQQFADPVGSALERCLFPRCVRVEDRDVLFGIKLLIGEGDEICADFSGLFVIKTEDGLVARIRDFLDILGKLDLRYKIPVISVFDGSHFVHAAEGGPAV